MPTPALPDGISPNGEAGLLASRAIARGIPVRTGRNGYLILGEGRGDHRFKKGWSTLVHPLAAQCTRQKEVTSALLRHKGIPAPANALFGGDELERAWRWATESLPVVVKPNAANKGTLVHVGLADRDSFASAFQRVADRYGSVLVEELASGQEHRFTTVGPRVVAVAQRVPMHVMGDGTSSIEALVEQKNDERRRRANPIHRRLRIDDEVLEHLRRSGIGTEDVPAAGEVVLLRATSNISTGGDAVDRTDEVPREVVELVEAAVAALPGLGCAGVDVMIATETATVLEVNPAPMMSLHHWPWEGRARDVYGAVLEAMFPIGDA